MDKGEFHLSCPYFFTREGATLSLVGLHRGASAFLIGGGPSFAGIDHGPLRRVWTMTLNNAAASYRSNANCSLGEVSQLNLSMWKDPLIQKFAPLSAFEKPLWDNRLLKINGKMVQQWRYADLLVGDCPNVIGYRRNEHFDAERFLKEESISCGLPSSPGVGRSVMLPALRVLHLLGFRTVYLLGFDFKITEKEPYHFPVACSAAVIRAKIKAFALLQRWLKELQPLFIEESFIVKNCTPKSALSVFPFISYEEAVEEATSAVGDYGNERVQGMGRSLEEKETEAEAREPQVSPGEAGVSSHAMKGGQFRTRKAAAPNESGEKRKLLLRNYQSPGDIVMLTAAVRDLHKCYPGQFQTDVRTSAPRLWENNPYLTPFKKKHDSIEVIDCQYPLIHRSNVGPWHFIHGFMEFLNAKLDLQIEPTEFKGDIHLSDAEKKCTSQVQEITGQPVPFWIIAAGGKLDFTIKWWEHERFQSVVDHFRGKILFVQVGEEGHQHPPLKGVLDLRGKTDLRELVRLVYHSQGVFCPVTLLMHLAAAVETPVGMPKNRPCVIVAGGREPPQWEAYPHHQFIHTNGALACCEQGGCWKSRTVPVGDGDEKDKPGGLCADVVLPANGASNGKIEPYPDAASAERKPVNALAHPPVEWPRLLPKCMDMISAQEVIQRIEIYFHGGTLKYLSNEEVAICKRTIQDLNWG